MGIFNKGFLFFCKWATCLILISAAQSALANATLPEEVGEGVFRNCVYHESISEVHCTSINNFNEQNYTINLSRSLTLRVDGNVTLPGGLSINPQNLPFNLVVSGAIQNNGALSLNGNIQVGSLTLSDASSRIEGNIRSSGAVTINNGQIIGSIEAGSVSFNNGSVMGSVRAGSLTVNSSATISGNVVSGSVMNNSIITGNVRVISEPPSNQALVVNNGSGYIGSVNSNSPVQNDGEIGFYINTPELLGNRAPPLLCNTRPEDNNTTPCSAGSVGQNYCEGIHEGLDYGIIGTSGFTYGNNSVINGSTIREPAGGLSGEPTTPTPTGEVDSAAPGFAELEVNFPFELTGGPNLERESAIPPGRYGRVATRQGGGNQPNLVSFGGGSLNYEDTDQLYYIERLELPGNPATVHFRQGIYFIEQIIARNQTYFTIEPGHQVIIHIGDRFISGNETYLNSDGNPGQLVINLHPTTTINIGNGNQGTDLFNFNGLIYSPYANTTIQLGNNNSIQGGILSAGSINVGNNTSFSYTDEVRNELIGAAGCDVATGPVVERFRIIQPDRIVSCRAAPVRVVACANNDCSERFNGPVSINLQSSEAVSWQGGHLNGEASGTNVTFTFDNGEGLVGMRNVNGGSVQLGISSSDPIAANSTLCTAANCQTEFVDSGLEVETTLYTRAGAAAESIVRALSTGSDGSCQPRLQNQTIPVSFELICRDPAICAAAQVFNLFDNNGAQVSSASANDMTFDQNGVLRVEHTYSDVGALRLNVAAFLEETPVPGIPPIDDPEITLLGSSALDFYSIPYALSLAPYKDDAIFTSTAETFAVAGEPFQVVIESRNRDGDITPSFGRESGQAVLDVNYQTSTQPAPDASEVGAAQLDTDGREQIIADGSGVVSNLVWDEVGELELLPRLSNYFSASEAVLSTIERAPGVVSRFIPAYFEIGLSAVEDAVREDTCTAHHGRSYTYLSQPEAAVRFEVLARNAKGALTRNYAAHYYAEEGLQMAGFELNSSSHGDERVSGIVNGTPWTAGRFHFNEENFAYPRRGDQLPDGPFRAERLGIRLATNSLDDDGVDFRSEDFSSPGTFPMIELEGELNLLYARLNLIDVSGPESESIAVAGGVEVFAFANDPFQGGADETPRFQPARFDHCSTLEAGRFARVEGPTASMEQSHTVQVIAGTVPDNRFGWQLDGIFDPTNAELLFEYDIGVSPWLGFPWRTEETNESPRALAIFGQYRGNDRIIFWLERGL